MNQTAFLLALFALINLFAFFAMWRDKAQSRQSEAERIPESFLFFMSIAFGALGVFLGMLVFRHKTQKWYFLLGVPLAFAENLAFLSVMWEYLGS